jgi:mycothiol synthase
VPELPVAELSAARFPEIATTASRIDDAARAADGHPALGDAVWLDLEHPGPDSAGFLANESGYAHVARADNTATDPTSTTDATAGAAPHWWLGAAVTPEARPTGVRARLVEAAVRHVATHGGGRLVFWVLGAGADDDTELAAVGLHPARDLYEMRVALPLAETAEFPADVHVRPFEIGRDEAAWIEVNNRAFAGHDEQGGWTEATLQRRMAEAWFDPALFLLAFDDEALLGFDWLKVHEAHDRDPRLGEIYVIGMDPRAQGRGLGRALAVAGLDAVRRRGIDVGMLFCAAGNEPALGLYRALGFTVHRIDRAYECEVEPA